MARLLIDGGILPKSEGSRPELITIEQLSYLLTAICVTSPSKTAYDTIDEYYNLQLDSAMSTDKSYSKAGDHIAAIMRDFLTNAHLFRKESVTIETSQPLVTVTTSFDPVIRAVYGDDRADGKPRAYVEIPPSTFRTIARLWHEITAQA